MVARRPAGIRVRPAQRRIPIMGSARKKDKHNRTTQANGRPITLAQLAEHKRLPRPFLESLGLADLPGGGVAISYYDAAGNELVVKRRTALKATEGSYWPTGVPLVAYGQNRLGHANRAGFLIVVEGESDCWALWHHEVPALGIPGSGAAKTLEQEHLACVSTVYVHREPDKSGETFVKGILARLTELGFAGKVFELRMPDGLKDPADLHAQGGATFKAKLEKAICDSTQKELPPKSRSFRGAGRARQEANDGRPVIAITTDEHVVNEHAARALTRDPAIYQRGGQLVRIIRDESPAGKGVRRALAPRIELLPSPLLRERLAANARWVTAREKKDGGVVETAERPPGWCVAAVHARGEWLGVRHLESVVSYPVLRPDGSILDVPGYDAATGLLLEPAGPVPPIPTSPSRRDAVTARDVLAEVVRDFPFERPAHRAAWFAGLLTPLARFAFTGPAPLFLADSNTRGVGKGLILDCISEIVTGERFCVATYTNDSDELRKRITSLALGGDRLVLLDNLEGKFGNPVLDAALTATSWEDRILGGNRMAKTPLFAVWYGSGNNIAVAGDTARRVCHLRLETAEERPEERADFLHPALLSWVGQSRGRLLAAALTVLRGYHLAGRPNMGLPAWGSFEGWSGLVRSAVVWVGLPDPGETRLLLQEAADVAGQCMGALLACWQQMDPDRHGLTAAEVIDRLYKHPPVAAVPSYHAEMKDAIEALLAKPDARGLGFKLRSYRRRVFGGFYFDHAGSHDKTIRWAVFPARDFRRQPSRAAGDGGDTGDSSGQNESDGDPDSDGHADAWEHPLDQLGAQQADLDRPELSPASPPSPGNDSGVPF
jgi:hypothetical protein